MKKLVVFVAICCMGVATAQTKDDKKEIKKLRYQMSKLVKAKRQCKCADYDKLIKEGTERLNKLLKK